MLYTKNIFMTRTWFVLFEKRNSRYFFACRSYTSITVS